MESASSRMMILKRFREYQLHGNKEKYLVGNAWENRNIFKLYQRRNESNAPLLNTFSTYLDVQRQFYTFTTLNVLKSVLNLKSYLP